MNSLRLAIEHGAFAKSAESPLRQYAALIGAEPEPSAEMGSARLKDIPDQEKGLSQTRMILGSSRARSELDDIVHRLCRWWIQRRRGGVVFGGVPIFAG